MKTYKSTDREQFFELYKTLPQELRDALAAEETGNTIYEVCKKNKIEDRLADVVDLTGKVLIGILAPANFQHSLEKEVRLNKKTAEIVASDIKRVIFFPVKDAISKLHETKTGEPERISTAKIPEEEIIQSADSAEIEEEPVVEEKPARRKGPDVYREPLE